MTHARLPWAAAMLDLLDAIRGWTRAAIKRNRHAAWLGGHDEGSFTSSWFAFAQLTGDPRRLGRTKRELVSAHCMTGQHRVLELVHVEGLQVDDFGKRVTHGSE